MVTGCHYGTINLRGVESVGIMKKAACLLVDRKRISVPELAEQLYGTDDRHAQRKAIRIVGLLRYRKGAVIDYDRVKRVYTMVSYPRPWTFS